jgi:hypothetical protein
MGLWWRYAIDSGEVSANASDVLVNAMVLYVEIARQRLSLRQDRSVVAASSGGRSSPLVDVYMKLD